jgi:anti-sigma factor RsiW
VTHPDHLADDVFSAVVDDQLSPDEVSLAQAHLEVCAACRARLEEMRTLVGLLRSVPSVEPPRDFRLGPRLVADPPNVVRLRRWYALTRVSAGALAAAFVFLSVGTLYVESGPVATLTSLASKTQSAVENAPGAAASDAAPTSAPPPTARAAAPAAAPQAPAAGAAVRSKAAAPTPTSAEPGDQIAAATTVRPLPTPLPTPTAVAQNASPFASSPIAPPHTDPAAALRLAAALVGILAAFGILAALLIRHRLLTASPSHPE